MQYNTHGIMQNENITVLTVFTGELAMLYTNSIKALKGMSLHYKWRVVSNGYFKKSASNQLIPPQQIRHTAQHSQSPEYCTKLTLGCTTHWVSPNTKIRHFKVVLLSQSFNTKSDTQQ